jgi:hypothetical protein
VAQIAVADLDIECLGRSQLPRRDQRADVELGGEVVIRVEQVDV